MDANTSYLNDHLAKEEAMDKRAERVQEMADFLMEEGQEYHPYSLKNFWEALRECSEAGELWICTTISSAVNLKMENSVLNEMAVKSIKDMVEIYWERLALKEAERRVE